MIAFDWSEKHGRKPETLSVGDVVGAARDAIGDREYMHDLAQHLAQQLAQQPDKKITDTSPEPTPATTQQSSTAVGGITTNHDTSAETQSPSKQVTTSIDPVTAIIPPSRAFNIRGDTCWFPLETLPEELRPCDVALKYDVLIDLPDRSGKYTGREQISSGSGHRLTFVRMSDSGYAIVVDPTRPKTMGKVQASALGPAPARWAKFPQQTPIVGPCSLPLQNIPTSARPCTVFIKAAVKGFLSYASGKFEDVDVTNGAAAFVEMDSAYAGYAAVRLDTRPDAILLVPADALGTAPQTSGKSGSAASALQNSSQDSPSRASSDDSRELEASKAASPSMFRSFRWLTCEGVKPASLEQQLADLYGHNRLQSRRYEQSVTCL